MHTEEISRWSKAIIISFLILTVYMLYMYVPSKRIDLFYFNKGFGSVAVLLAGFTLLIGPLSRSHKIFMFFMSMRRQLGELAFVYASIHFIISLFFLPSRFPISWHLTRWYSILFGLAGLGIWAYLIYISRNSQILKMGSEVWKKHQQTGGWIAFILVLLHLIHLKYSFWVEWITKTTTIAVYKNNPWYIPANLIITLFVLGVIIYRLIIKFNNKPTDTQKTSRS